MKRSIALGLLCVGLAACTGGGPRTSAILGNSDAVRVTREVSNPYAVIDVDQNVAYRASRWAKEAAFSGFIADTGSRPVVIGSGDTLEISIVSTSAESGYLDITNSSISPISTTRLPDQEVGSDGLIAVPPLGRVRAAGQSVQQFENFLTRRLGEVLVDPAAIVRIADRRSARVSVMGQVASPGTYSINLTNRHLVEMIAQAGGPTGRSDTLGVSVSRGGKTGSASLRDVYENPNLNIHVASGDVISVESPAKKFTVLGAGGTNTTMLLDEVDVTLADALGRAGGLLNRRADREGVFLYRTISKAAAIDLGADVDVFEGEDVPTIFRVDLSEPQSIFTAQSFHVADGDVLYISDSFNEEINAISSAFSFFSPEPARFISDEAFGIPGN